MSSVTDAAKSGWDSVRETGSDYAAPVLTGEILGGPAGGLSAGMGYYHGGTEGAMSGFLGSQAMVAGVTGGMMAGGMGAFGAGAAPAQTMGAGWGLGPHAGGMQAAGMGMTPGGAVAGASPAAAAGAGGFHWGHLALGGMDLLAGEHQRREMAQMQQEMMERGDPFGDEREHYIGRLRELTDDPSVIEDLPGFEYRRKMAREGLSRQLGAAGHHLSGRELAALQEHEQAFLMDEYDREFQRLSGLAGAGIGPGAGVQAGTQLGMAQAQVRQRQFETIGRGVQRLFGGY